MDKFTIRPRARSDMGRSRRWWSLGRWLQAAGLLLLAACAAEPPPNPTAPNTVLPSPTLTPSPPRATEAAATRPPGPTRAATLSAAAGTATPCGRAYFFTPAPPSCPAGVPRATAAAEQPFEGGVMIWLEETDAILVLHQDQTWQSFEDTWAPGQPEDDPTLTPPAGRFQPIRGFGKLWRERPEVRKRLGWALGVELAFEALLQEQASAAGEPPVTFVRVYNGQVLALTAREPDRGDWGVAAA